MAENTDIIDETQELQDTDSTNESSPIMTTNLDDGDENNSGDEGNNGNEDPIVPPTDPTDEPVDDPKEDDESDVPADVAAVAKDLSKVVANFFKFHQDLISFVNEPENKKFTIIIKYSYAREPEINKVAQFFKMTIYDSSVVFDENLKVTCVNCNDTTMKFVTLTAKDYEDTMDAIVDGSSDIAKSIASRLNIVPKNYYTFDDLEELTDKISLFITNMNGDKEDGSFITSTYSRFGIETKMAGNKLMFTVNTDLLNKRCIELDEKGVTECQKALIDFNPIVKTFLSFVEKYGMNALTEIDKLLKEADSPISLQRKSGKTLIFVYDLSKKPEQTEDKNDGEEENNPDEENN